MSTIVANSVTGKELFLFGDTIVTTLMDKDARPGITSHGEVYVPIVNREGQPIGFSESACKVGSLGENAVVGMAGDAEFGYAILDFIYSYPNSLSRVMDLRAICIAASKMLTPSSFPVGSVAEFIFCIKDDGFHICVGKYTVQAHGVLDFWFDGKLMTTEKVHQYMLGSGRDFLRKYIPQDILVSCARDPSLIDVAIQMMWMDYSRKLRLETRGHAAGVGGAFLGFCINSSGINLPKDTLFISADRDAVVEYMTKIAYRAGLFIITDFMNRSVNVVRTIDGEINYRKKLKPEYENITDLVWECAGLYAEVSMVSYYVSGEEYPYTNIVENKDKNVLKGSALEKGYMWVEPEQEMTFKFQNDQVLKLKIPRAHPYGRTSS
jgi:hypothetical protein